MTEAKHTPGPWRTQLVGGHEVDLITKGGTFAGINAGSGAPDSLDADDYAEWLANVGLIAAAPDMLEALESVHKLWAETAGLGFDEEMKWPSPVGAVWNEVRAAIRKATGAQ